jgi:hypothetical protein
VTLIALLDQHRPDLGFKQVHAGPVISRDDLHGKER